MGRLNAKLRGAVTAVAGLAAAGSYTSLAAERTAKWHRQFERGMQGGVGQRLQSGWGSKQMFELLQERRHFW